MSSLTFIFVLVTILAILFLALNFLLAPRDPNSIKESPFECGFSSHLGQNRAHFDVQFFLVALVYLLLDLEILIIYPFAMSGRENGVYGLILVLIIIFIITVGFIFELGKKALYINSRQNETVDLDNEDLQIDEDKEYIYRINGKPNLQLGKIQIRTYSSLNSPSGDPDDEGKPNGPKPKKSKNHEFWSKIYSKDVTNPSIIVNDFHQKNAKLIIDLILNNITYDLINIIMGDKGLKLTREEFDQLKCIDPIHMKNIRRAKLKAYENIGGVYVFTCDTTDDKYVGSSISLGHRIARGYLGSNLGKRRIEDFIKEIGIENFTLDLYILPQELINAFLSRLGIDPRDKTTKEYKKGIQKLSLTLEQILILLYNPTKNVLKVAGSTVGQRPEKFKRTFLYDIQDKKLICKTESRTQMAFIMGIKLHELSTLIMAQRMYLDERYQPTSELLDESDYSTNLMTEQEVSDLMENHRAENCKKVKLTNIKTGEVKIFDSIKETTKYINTCGDKFKKVTHHSLYQNIKNKNPYRGVFRLAFYKDKDKDK